MLTRSLLKNQSPLQSTLRRAFSKLPKYGLAISRDIPSSFENAVTKFASQEAGYSPIDIEKAREEHRNYVDRLRQFVPTLTLPPLDDSADSVFVEDTVVAVGNRAVITNPGHPSRRGEVDTIRDVLSRLGYDVVDMRDTPGALCDGGDVMYTTRHLFVGLSARTNEEAAKVLSEAFPEVETIGVPFEDEALHLKSVVSHLDPETLFAPIGPAGDEVLKALKAKERGYEAIRLPNMLACNVVSANGGVLAQDRGCAESKAKLTEAAAQRNLAIEFVDASEVAKCDGALTCCSVLLEVKADN